MVSIWMSASPRSRGAPRLGLEANPGQVHHCLRYGGTYLSETNRRRLESKEQDLQRSVNDADNLERMGGTGLRIGRIQSFSSATPRARAGA